MKMRRANDAGMFRTEPSRQNPQVRLQVTAPIDFEASGAVRAALAALGRTEDVRFSPDNRLLAIAGFGRSRCLILRIDVTSGPDGPAISIGDHIEITSPGIGEVHGLDFIDNETIVVANRDGLVAVLRLPSGEFAGRHCHVETLREIRGGLFRKLRAPGSVAVRREASGLLSLLVCNSYAHRVTRHVLGPPSYRAWWSRILLKRGLDIPDGIALSHDGKWIAVSSHNTCDIKIFDARTRLGPQSEPVGILENANYPHGLRFTPDDRHLLVADAGGPVVNIYSTTTDWRGSRAPSRTAVVLDDEAFQRGRTSAQEGGPKGLDIDRSNKVFAITCEEQPLAFFALESVLDDQPAKALIQPIGA